MRIIELQGSSIKLGAGFAGFARYFNGFAASNQVLDLPGILMGLLGMFNGFASFFIFILFIYFFNLGFWFWWDFDGGVVVIGLCGC